MNVRSIHIAFFCVVSKRAKQNLLDALARSAYENAPRNRFVDDGFRPRIPQRPRGQEFAHDARDRNVQLRGLDVRIVAYLGIDWGGG
jgi:hypothetical protein